MRASHAASPTPNAAEAKLNEPEPRLRIGKRADDNKPNARRGSLREPRQRLVHRS